MVRTGLEVRPATVDAWPALGNVYGPRAKDPDSCWCQRFRRPERAMNRDALAAEIAAAQTPIGLLAYADGSAVPVGWTRVVLRSTLPAIMANRAISRIVGDDQGGWWVSCFVVRREYRGQGVGVALLEAAVGWAASHGAMYLDGHPVDTALLIGSPSPSAVFTGTLSMFRRAQFVEIGRTYRSRPVMRRTVEVDQ